MEPPTPGARLYLAGYDDALCTPFRKTRASVAWWITWYPSLPADDYEANLTI